MKFDFDVKETEVDPFLGHLRLETQGCRSTSWDILQLRIACPSWSPYRKIISNHGSFYVQTSIGLRLLLSFAVHNQFACTRCQKPCWYLHISPQLRDALRVAKPIQSWNTYCSEPPMWFAPSFPKNHPQTTQFMLSNLQTPVVYRCGFGTRQTMGIWWHLVTTMHWQIFFVSNCE